MTISSFNELNVMASTMKGERITIAISMNDDNDDTIDDVVYIELTKRNAQWLRQALKNAIELRKC